MRRRRRLLPSGAGGCSASGSGLRAAHTRPAGQRGPSPPGCLQPRPWGCTARLAAHCLPRGPGAHRGATAVLAGVQSWAQGWVPARCPAAQPCHEAPATPAQQLWCPHVSSSSSGPCGLTLAGGCATRAPSTAVTAGTRASW